MNYVGVKFKDEGNTYNFESELQLNLKDKVIVETERGEQLGVVDKLNCSVSNGKKIKKVLRVATDEDYNTYLKNANEAKKALIEARKEAEKMGLNMNIIDATYSLDRAMLLFNFISDERVDFREFVKKIAAKYHTRIELHQIGIRDKAREIGGIGLCGRSLCCSSTLKNLCTVNISMVKNQNIALNPTKINGACGRLLCCFNYENEIYEANRKELPKVGEKVKYKGKYCEVTELDILNKKYKIKLSDGNYEEVVVNATKEWFVWLW